jgi:spectinomycin phosphotransferase
MRAIPEGLDERDLFDALRDGWGLDTVAAVYVPVGGGSYHWQVDDGAGVRHWVTVDDLDHKGFLGATRDVVFDCLRRAFDTACALRSGGLEFVVAPVPTPGGESVRRLDGRHAVTVFPFLDASTGLFGEYRSAAERAAVVDMLVRLHRAPPAAARVARPQVPHRAGLERALAEVDRPWSSGPYAERARARLAGHAAQVRGLLHRFDRLADQVRATGAAHVLTHGEPHPGNVIFAHGRVLLIDWDTVALALPERDLWMLDTDDDRDRYLHASGRPVDGAAIDLYRLRWHLDDIASTVQLFRSPHGENADTAQAWGWFAGSLESDGVWPYARR